MMLFNEVNNLKVKLKQEIDSRKKADDDILQAINKYKDCISSAI